MKFPNKSKIALDVLIDVAQCTEHGLTTTILELSKKHGISRSYLEVIFSKLKAYGLVQGHRGPGGGYSLSLQPNDIRLNHIVNIFNNDNNLNNEFKEGFWFQFEAYMNGEMSRISLAQFIRRSQPAINLYGDKKINLSETKLLDSISPGANNIVGPPFLNSIFSLGEYLQEQNAR